MSTTDGDTDDFDQPDHDTIHDVHNAVYREVWRELRTRDDLTETEARHLVTHMMYEDNEMVGASPIREPNAHDYGVFDEVGVEFAPENATAVVDPVIERLLDDRETYEGVHGTPFEEEYADDNWHWPQFAAKLKRNGHTDLIPEDARIPVDRFRDLIDGRFDVSTPVAAGYDVSALTRALDDDEVLKITCDLGTFRCRYTSDETGGPIRLRTADEAVQAAADLYFVNQHGRDDAEQYSWMVNRGVPAEVVEHWLFKSDVVSIEAVEMDAERYW